MKEELIRVLNAKLDDINANIDSLLELNKKIEEEQEKLAYVKDILSLFKTEEGYNILNFVKLSRGDFDKIVQVVLKDDTIFNSDSCNYDGLIYLINGINNGVSLTLTEEQKNNIEYLIRGLKSRGEEYTSTIEGLNLVKERFQVSNLDVLNSDRLKYEGILDNLKNDEYVNDTEALKEAFDFYNLDNSEIIALLSYVLSYNAEIYRLKNTNDVEKTQESQDETEGDFTFSEVNKSDFAQEDDKEDVFYAKPLSEERKIDEVEKKEPELEEEPEVQDNQTKINETENIPAFDFELPMEEKEPEEESENVNNEILEDNIENSPEEEPIAPVEEVAMPFETFNFELPKEEPEEVEEIASEDDEIMFTPPVQETEIPNVEEYVPPIEEIPSIKEEPKIDLDFVDVDENYNENEISSDEMSSKELYKVLTEYNIQSNLVNTNELLVGDIKNYRRVLDILKENNILDEFKKNKELFTKVMISSTDKDVEQILKVIREDLSVDDEDYNITLRIAINTIPSIFIREGGNYDNFIKNIEFFRSLDINLINLFDFSKEVLIANNNRLVNNLEIVKEYKVELSYNNVKYFLLLPNIAERMDYYIESVYKDKNKNEIFDGIDFINHFAVKLNIVEPLTIKRLRFASENGNKVFGSKPYSLSGEITNLKVNALEINDSYLNNFFNDQFDGITNEEVKQYVKLIHNTSNVGNYSDELDVIEKYHNGLRYVIGDINISYNKVVRNYNILRSYGVSNSKALHFAVCHNLVITKNEYADLKKKLELGGNA